MKSMRSATSEPLRHVLSANLIKSYLLLLRVLVELSNDADFLFRATVNKHLCNRPHC